MPLDFPNSPALNDVYNSAGKTWQWNGTTWVLLGISPNISVGTEQLVDNAVTSAKIAAGAVVEADIADGAVTQAKMASTVSGVTICTSSTRPGSPFIGQVIYETNNNLMRVWLGSSWSNGTAHSTSIAIEYLVVAGGGGGGGSTSGGGGAGGYRSSVQGESSGGGASAESSLTLSPGTYAVTVGGGGTAGRNSDSGAVNNTNGSNSIFHTITSLGGGYGASGKPSGSRVANSGGSGGGGGSYNGNDIPTMSAGAGTTSQGFAGGTITTIGGGGYGGTGGGGAGGLGVANGGTVFGAGGPGVTSSITGSPVTRGGGGGSGGSTGGSGGSGGGGAGGNNGGTAGTANTGGGGGGQGTYQSPTGGGAGGSGVVIVRYLTADAAGLTITGGTSTIFGTYTVRTFTSSGSLVIS